MFLIVHGGQCVRGFPIVLASATKTHVCNETMTPSVRIKLLFGDLEYILLLGNVPKHLV
jgi:hypothetical protein